jgi:hypothetical protein
MNTRPKYTRISTRGFRRWWSGIKRQSPDRQRQLLLNWLKYACKTVALRGDQHQQRVVYACYQRYTNSEFAYLSRDNAQRVYQIVNQHQENYRKLRDRLRAQWVAEIQAALPPDSVTVQNRTTGGVVVRHTTRKTIIRGTDS